MRDMQTLTKLLKVAAFPNQWYRMAFLGKVSKNWSPVGQLVLTLVLQCCDNKQMIDNC